MTWKEGEGGMARSYKYIFCTCNKKVYASVLPEMLFVNVAKCCKGKHCGLLFNQLSFYWTLLIRLFMDHLLTLLLLFYSESYISKGDLLQLP